MKVCINGQGHMTKMAAMALQVTDTCDSFSCTLMQFVYNFET